MAQARHPKQNLEQAIQKESRQFEECYRWIEMHMPPSLFDEIDEESVTLVARSLMGFNLQDFFSQIHLKHCSIVLCLDSPDADLRILERYKMYGIKNYTAFVSNASVPFPGVGANLRIGTLFFTEFEEGKQTKPSWLSREKEQEILHLVKGRNSAITDEEFHKLLSGMNPRFLRAMTKERLSLAIEMFFRAKTRDQCQYHVRYNEEWKEKRDTPSLQIVLAWKSVPKYNFLYRLAKIIHRHKLSMMKVNAAYIDPYSPQSILIMSLGLHGSQGKAAWEEADIADFLQELATLKCFEEKDEIETLFVDTGLVSGNLGNLIKTMASFVHQALVHADAHMYSPGQIQEALCRHPELTVQLCEAFEWKFHPQKSSLLDYNKSKEAFLSLIDDLDTGNETNDTRRKNILATAMHFIDFTLKTNFYRTNKSALSFRLDPRYLDELPYDRKEKFPELPYGIFFMNGRHFLGFHIRFKDLSRGGLRTIIPDRPEQMHIERNHVFSECYALAYTQQKKNKDIPEGGAKGVILLKPFEQQVPEQEVYARELEAAGVSSSEIATRLKTFAQEHQREFLYQSQRAYIESLLTLINCEADGLLRAKQVVDYLKKPEYIYLGPDENMHNVMIEWISDYSKMHHYKPGSCFMSSKPGAGINHKEYGVTSFGVNVYMEEVLKHLGIDPSKQSFTIKMSGGPDGDVAGNQILNLHKFFPKTAKLLALIDVSGTIFDPNGLDLNILAQFFHEAKPLRFYPPEKLSEGGFLLDAKTKKEQTPYVQQTLCWRKKGGKVIEEWLSGNEMNHILRHTVHQTKADIFIPGGGRPRTLNETNYKDFLDETGKPTSKAIVEGANLYLTPLARRALENLGVLIIKDSSANKGGVICSSLEVLAGLTLSDELFIKEKATLVKEFLEIIAARAKDEAHLLLSSQAKSGAFLTDLSEQVSEKVNTFMYQILDYLQPLQLSSDPNDPLIRSLLNYCPPLLRMKYAERVLHEVPDIHKKAIIACYIASQLVYRRGLDWSPTIVDVLPLLATSLSP